MPGSPARKHEPPLARRGRGEPAAQQRAAPALPTRCRRAARASAAGSGGACAALAAGASTVRSSSRWWAARSSGDGVAPSSSRISRRSRSKVCSASADVALRGLRLHQQRVAGLAERRERDDPPARRMRARCPRPPRRAPRAPAARARRAARPRARAGSCVEPRRVDAGQQPALEDVEGGLGLRGRRRRHRRRARRGCARRRAAAVSTSSCASAGSASRSSPRPGRRSAPTQRRTPESSVLSVPRRVAPARRPATARRSARRA